MKFSGHSESVSKKFYGIEKETFCSKPTQLDTLMSKHSKNTKKWHQVERQESKDLKDPKDLQILVCTLD